MNKRGNTSTAVMQRRREAKDSFDDFPTPPWATRGLVEYVIRPRCVSVSEQTVWEPACNRGYMARPLGEYFGRVIASDINDYGWTGQERTSDFLFEGRPERLDWIVTNPPFRLAARFADHALKLRPTHGVALLVRLAFLEGIERFETIYSKCPPSLVAQYVERVPMVSGRFDPDAASATAYCWLVWLSGASGPTELTWIPPCRERLRRPDDVAWEQKEVSASV